MRKLFLLSAVIAAGLAVTSCSSDKDVAENTGPIENGGGNYIAISINLPTDPASAAKSRTEDNNGNVTYNDGRPVEYEVKDATVIIFDKSGGFVEARTIDPKPWKESTDDNVTRVSTKVVQSVGGSVAKDYQMLVILNNNGLINVTSTNGLQVWNASLGTPAFEDFTGNFSAFQALTTAATTTGLDCGKMDDSGYYMANAPLADKQGSTSEAISGATVQVLVPITQVYSTEGEASAGKADQIYVERGMAKVTMEKAVLTETLSNSKIGGTTALKATVTGWTLDNCNPSSYLVRSTDGHSDFLSLKSNSSTSTAAVYRYIGNTAITEGSPTKYKYRTYFAKSANYDKSGMDLETPTFSLNRATSTFSTAFGPENPKFCFENTFSVDDQDVNKTTLVQVAVQAIADGGSAADLYTVNGNKSSIYTETTLKELLASKAAEWLTANSKVKSGTLSSKDITVTLGTADDEAKIASVTMSYNTTTDTSEGDATLMGSAFGKTDGTDDATSGDLVSDACTYAVSEIGTILKYKDGISYYSIRIKHFGDKLTPWNENETTKPSTGTIYPTDNANNNYLGRYGVLRNNWYNLQVSSIKSLGEAVPHTSKWPGTPDDELDNYITFQINVLSWAKHDTQKQEL